MTEPASTGTKLRVLVIGAGYAGIAAAKRLAANPAVHVTVLEASSSVGGRAKAGQLPSGTNVELGATWFHGVRDNPVYDIAVYEGVAKDIRGDPEASKHDIDWQLHFARPLEPTLLQGEPNNVAMEAISRYTEVAEECTQGATSKDGSVGDVLRRTFDEAVEAENLQGSSLQTFADAWHFRELLQRTFDGFFSTDDVSLAFAREYETLDGPNLPVPGGYQALAELLARGLDVRCNHRVTCIQYGAHGARVVCENGSVLEADAVLVTLSLGVLQQQHGSLFDPPLPAWKQEALGALRIGVADKVFVEFEIEPARAMDAAMWLTSHNTSSAWGSGFSFSGAASGAPSARPSCNGVDGLQHSSTGNNILASGAVTGLHANGNGSTPQHPAVAPASPVNHLSASATPSPQHLPPEIACALPPPATGGQPEPFNIGRKPSMPLISFPTPPSLLSDPSGRGSVSATLPVCLEEDSEMSAATRLLAPTSTSATHVIVPPPPAPSAGRRRRKQRRTIHSYAFLWPVAEPHCLGTHGQGTFTGAVPVSLPPSLMGLGLPAWCLGLHSLRYCPSPEWIQPAINLAALTVSSSEREPSSEGSGGMSATLLTAGGGLGKRGAAEAERITPAVSPACGGATHISGVLWITGEAAVAMEGASDEEVVGAVSNLFKAFPGVPLPPGAKFPPTVQRTKWGSDPLFQGSYSYIRVGHEDGEAVDVVGEPLCNDDGMPIVLFAGEATHRQYVGTVHGAFLSGYREAERLLIAMQHGGLGSAARQEIVDPKSFEAVEAGIMYAGDYGYMDGLYSMGPHGEMAHMVLGSASDLDGAGAFDPTQKVPIPVVSSGDFGC